MVFGHRLDSLISEVFSNLADSVIKHTKPSQQQLQTMLIPTAQSVLPNTSDTIAPLSAKTATLPAPGIQSLLAQLDSPLVRTLHNQLFSQPHPSAKAEAKFLKKHGHIIAIFSDFKQRTPSATQTLSEVAYKR